MRVTFLQQPFAPSGEPATFGMRLVEELLSGRYQRARIISAYATSGGANHLYEGLRQLVAQGGRARVLVGLGNGVTSKQAVQRLLETGAKVQGFATGTHAILHSKLYLLEAEEVAWTATGSANLTEDGLFRNFETMVLMTLHPERKQDRRLLRAMRRWPRSLRKNFPENLRAMLPENLDADVEAGLLIDETVTKSAQRKAILKAMKKQKSAGGPRIRIPRAPAPAQGAPGAPSPQGVPTSSLPAAGPVAVTAGPLVWEKKALPDSDALRPANPNSKFVGAVRLTKAGFKVAGGVIDQTTYFRQQVFGQKSWSPKTGSKTFKETAWVRFRVHLLGHDLGEYDLLVTHTPSGAAGQDNFTTVIHWGTELSEQVRKHYDLRGKRLRLHAPVQANGPFLLDVS